MKKRALNKRDLFLSIPVLILFLWMFAGMAHGGEQSSANYTMMGGLFSGGGGEMVFEGYEMKSTIGQASPLMDPLEPPISENYDLYPGFWYTISMIIYTCPGDSDRDKDIDGEDLADYIFDSGGLGLDEFAVNFGKINCP